MRCLLFVPLLASLSGLVAQQPGAGGGLATPSKTSLLLLIEGNTKAMIVTAAWRKSVPFLRPLQDERHRGEVVLYDLLGVAVYRQRLDLSDFTWSGGKDEITGDVIRKARLALLTKLPDLGQRLSSLRIRVHQDKVWKEVGRIDAAALNRLLVPQFRPMAATVKTHLNSGPIQNRYDIVILGDGYQASEQNKFYADIAKWMNNLFAREPYKTYRPFFNVHSVFSASKESGADHPDRTPPIVKDTVYDAGYSGRCLYLKNGKQALTDAALAPDVEGRLVVFVNDGRYGGCAGTFAVSYNGASGPEVQSHEFGHTFGRLADEYDYGRSGAYSGPEPYQANISADPTGRAKWPAWLGYKAIGAYEGAHYYKKGMFRPEFDCLMRSLGRPMCHICIEAVAKESYGIVTPIENASPAPGPINLTGPATKTITFSNLVPGGGKIEWKIGSTVLQRGGTSFVLDSSKLPLGDSKLDLVVTDNTIMIRKLPPSRGVQWRLTNTDPSAADLAIKTVVAPSSIANGSTFDLITTIENKGKSPAGAFELEHFVALGSSASAASTYLGSVKVAGLAASNSVQVKRSLSIPYHLLQGQATILAHADRAETIRDGARSNNQGSTSLNLTSPAGCNTSLEFADELVWPTDRSSISLLYSDMRNLRVTSPCHKGNWALVLWSLKGTNPGIRIGNVTVPLNFDPVATPFALSNANTGPFYFFFTPLDGQGQSTPLVYLIKAFNIQPFNSHMAAVIWKSDFSTVLSASNPVQLDFVK